MHLPCELSGLYCIMSVIVVTLFYLFISVKQTQIPGFNQINTTYAGIRGTRIIGRSRVSCWRVCQSLGWPASVLHSDFEKRKICVKMKEFGLVGMNGGEGFMTAISQPRSTNSCWDTVNDTRVQCCVPNDCKKEV